MKITNLSLAAIAAVAMTTGAMADVDMKIGGQAVVYYQTADAAAANTDMFNKDASSANFGLQLNANSDLGNGFGLGLQGTGLSTLGLEDNLVSGVRQSGLGNTGDTTHASGYFSMTKAYLTKQVGNTTLKMGRQELPKSLSPLAFSESWNVYKNTFDAVVAINSDIPDTTLVGAYVDRSNNHADLGTFDEFQTGKAGAEVRPDKGAYMLTAQNKSLDGVTLTGSYYALPVGAAPHTDAFWLDAKTDLNTLAKVPVKLAVQGGQLKPDGLDDTNVLGVKASAKTNGVNLSLAYSKVGAGTLSVQNVGTGVKTPLYTQMIGNQNFIAHDNDTVVLGASMPVGSGKLIANYDMTTDNSAASNDYTELDLIYKTKLLGTNVLAAYVMQQSDNKIFAKTKDGVATEDTNNIIRVWTRYNF